jgi:hypothetical protein
VREVIDHLAPMPALQRLMTAEAAAGTMASGGEGGLWFGRCAHHDHRHRPHAAADKNGLADGGESHGEIGLTRAKGTGCAVDEDPTLPPVDLVQLLFAGVV